MVDYHVISGHLWLFTPTSARAKRHARRHFAEATKCAGAIAVEPRYAMDCLYGIASRSHLKCTLDGREIAAVVPK